MRDFIILTVLVVLVGSQVVGAIGDWTHNIAERTAQEMQIHH